MQNSWLSDLNLLSAISHPPSIDLPEPGALVSWSINQIPKDLCVTGMSSESDVADTKTPGPSTSRAMATEKGRTKKWAPKTFNGCLTCKRRRIKCDEGKPACQRCIKSNIKCSGYAPPKIRLFEPASSGSSSIQTSTVAAATTTTTTSPPASTTTTTATATARTTTTSPAAHEALALPTGNTNELQLQSYLPSYTHPRELALVPRFGTPDEYQSFQFFLEKTSDLISVYSQPYLWTVLLPQATWHQASIKHSIIALASLHQFLTTIGPSSQRASHNFMFHYNTAIRALVTDKPSVDIVLAACVIFWALENFNGSGQAAFDHMKAALKILSEWKVKKHPSPAINDLISKYIEPTIRDGVKFASKWRVEELSSQMGALSLTTRDVRIMNLESPVFDSLEMAEKYLGALIHDILTLQTSDDFSPGAEVTERIDDLDARLYKWMNLFQNLTATGPAYVRRMLIVHNVAANILLDQLKAQAEYPAIEEEEQPSRLGPGSEERSRFSFTATEIEDLVRCDHSPTAVECFKERPPTLGLLPPIFLVATSAPRVEIRRRAINALGQIDVVEGPWTSEIAARIAEQILHIAHEAAVPLDTVELRDMQFKYHPDRQILGMRWVPQFTGGRELEALRHFEASGLQWSDDVPELIQRYGYQMPRE